MLIDKLSELLAAFFEFPEEVVVVVDFFDRANDQIPMNFMFIGCPGSGLPHALAEFGGVRVIV
jgi:hypothetical protein